MIKWAQRKDNVYIEVQLRDTTDEVINLSANTIKFKGTSDSKVYEFELEFFEEIDTESSKWNKTGFHLLFVLAKKDPSKPFWTRLTKNKEKNQYIQIDWTKWVDEDEE